MNNKLSIYVIPSIVNILNRLNKCHIVCYWVLGFKRCWSGPCYLNSDLK